MRYVINTHQHDDHAGGDFKMLPIAEVIAHKNVRANLADIKRPYYEDTPGTPIGLPRITFSNELAVHVGGKEVSAHYFGRGHTSGDAVIYFPEVKVIHTGDLFLAIRGGGRGAPPARPRPPGVPIYVDYVQGGSFLDWSKTMDEMLKLDFDTVIPGHGPVSTRADVVKFKSDLETMRTRLTGLIKEGKSKSELAKILEDDYGWRSTGCPPSPPTPGLPAVPATGRADQGARTMRSVMWALLLALAAAMPVAAQQATLTPQDYLDIQQLVSKYAYAIDECTNKGYDYADLYVADGAFLTSRNGKILNRFEGRERLAEAARGGMPDCKDVPWAGIVHMLVNHVIEPAQGGATGKVYLIAIGVDGEPGKVEAQGRYEDVYVKTANGWRFKSRTHVLAAGQQEVSRGSKPNPAK